MASSHSFMPCKSIVLLNVLLFVASTAAQSLTDAQVTVVKARLEEGAKQSWELGTRAEALIEYDTPSYSVLNGSSLPPPQSSPPSSLDTVFSIAQSVVSARAKSNNNTVGPQPLISGGAAGDPASIGVAVLLANWTGKGESDGIDYAGAASDQLEYLLEVVPRTSDGAISHRLEKVQLWSDFVYMVPPFLAYYGVLSANQTLVEEAYTQVKLYRQYLVDDSAGGMWKHILLGNTDVDEGHWSTGNGWAAAGMLRVLATIQNSQFANNMKNEQKDLANWVREIHDGIYPYIQSSGLFRNYADQNDTFDDASSTAILASTVYRLALLVGTHTHLPLAERARAALSALANTTSAPSPSSTSTSIAPSASGNSTTSSNITSSDNSTISGLEHFTSAGWLTPVVNPESFGAEGSESPEGQAFVVEMQAAWRDWVALGSPGASAAHALSPGAGFMLGAVLALLGVL